MPNQTRRVAKEARNRRWFQLIIVAGVVLLAAAILLLKNRGAGTPAVTHTPPESTAGKSPSAAVAAPDELPQAQLTRLLAAGQPTLAFFHSNNCVQCTKMMQVVADVYPEFDDSVALVDVNVYDQANAGLLQVFRIRAIPTQIFFDRNGQSRVILGAMTPDGFREQMQSLAGEQ
jgi:thiol:disulfide interchange protein